MQWRKTMSALRPFHYPAKSKIKTRKKISMEGEKNPGNSGGNIIPWIGNPGQPQMRMNICLSE